jgi:hypothetical protein
MGKRSSSIVNCSILNGLSEMKGFLKGAGIIK